MTLAHSASRPIPTKAGALAAAFAAVLALGSPLPASAQGAGARTQTSVTVDSIAVEGNVRQSRAEVMAVAGLRPGTPITYRDVQTAVKELWSTGQFRDIQVRASGGQAGAPVVLTYQVEERELMRTVRFPGLETVSAQSVRDTVDLRPGQPYSPQKVSRAMRYIRSELSDQGIPFARIEERRQRVEGADGEIHLVLDVTEGNRVTVAGVQVEGNESFSDGALSGALDTSPEGFWWFQGGTYDQETFQSDLEQRLPSFYAGRGYLDFEIVSDTLVVDPETGKAQVELSVVEGPQYRVADFSIEGNRHFATEELSRYYRLDRGGLLSRLGFGGGDESGDRDPVFDRMAFEEATNQVQRAYNNEGYLYARVSPYIEKLGAEGEGSPKVRVGWEIEENNPAYINRVAIEGNDYTYERVIRDQIILLPGDVYSEDRLLQSYQSIQSLGFFETPMEPPDIQPDPQTGDVDVTFRVKEKQTGSINFGTAVGGGTGLSGFIGYDQPNLFGQAKQGSLRWDFGRFINSFTASYSDPALLGSRISGSLTFFNSSDRFFQFDSGRRKRLGGSVQFGIPVPWSRFTRFIAGYGISRTRFDLRRGVDDTSLFGRPPGLQSTVTLGLNRSTLNHPVFPTSGSRQRVTFDLNGGPLGGDGSFTRQLMEGTWWLPVGQVGGGSPGSQGMRFALGLKLRGGAVYGNADRFPFDRFWMGGVQFGESLRGYDETSITPQGHFFEGSRAIRDIDRLGDAFFLMSAEYAARLGGNVSLSLFYDAGNVYTDPFEVDPTRLFRGAGVGVQLVTPFGPIGLDYAYGFDKDPAGWQLHFRMGPRL